VQAPQAQSQPTSQKRAGKNAQRDAFFDAFYFQSIEAGHAAGNAVPTMGEVYVVLKAGTAFAKWLLENKHADKVHKGSGIEMSILAHHGCYQARVAHAQAIVDRFTAAGIPCSIRSEPYETKVYTEAEEVAIHRKAGFSKKEALAKAKM
jgi:hypothetical protein